MRDEYYLSFTNLEKAPQVVIDTDLCIGSQIGDYIISEAGVSARHCTFSLSQDVISLKDHGSKQGTFINDVQIASHRVFILIPGDRIKIGKFVEAELIKIEKNDHIGNEHLAQWDQFENFHKISDFSEPIIEKKIIDERVDKKIEPVQEFDFPIDEESSAKIKINKKNDESKKILAAAPIRFFAFVIDMLLTMTINNLFTSYSWWESISSFARLKIVNTMIAHKVINDFSFIIDFSSLFMLTLLISNLIWGQSLGQKMVGIKVIKEAFLLTRIKAFARTLIGFVTLPFLIFDIPSLIPKRTFKEWVTKTVFLYQFKSIHFLKNIMLFILFLSFAFFSPMIQGFKIEKSYDLRLQEMSTDHNGTQEGELLVSFKELLLSIPLKPNYFIIPSVDSQGEGEFILHPSELKQGSVLVKIDKMISMSSILKKTISSDPFFSHHFPTLHRFIKRSELDTKFFRKKQWSLTEEKKFKSELTELIAESFKLNMSNLWSHIFQYGPFIKGYLDLRASLYSMVDSWDNLEMKMIGDTVFLVFQKENIGESDYLIPLYSLDEWNTFKLIPTHLSNRAMIFPTIYNDYFLNAQWGKTTSRQNEVVIGDSALGILDILVSISRHHIKVTNDIATKLYQFYFSLAGRLIEYNHKELSEDYIKSLKSTIAILHKEKASDMENKLKDVLEKFLNKNVSYFGLSTGVIK